MTMEPFPSLRMARSPSGRESTAAAPTTKSGGVKTARVFTKPIRPCLGAPRRKMTLPAPRRKMIVCALLGSKREAA